MSNAPLLWAQRSSEDEESKNVLLITIEAPELDDSYTLEFPEEGSKLVFKGKSKAYPSAGHTEQPKEYAIDLELFDKVNTDSVKKSLTGKSLNIVVQKKELKIEYWPRLTKDKKKLQFIKTDFSKWVDEDEQDAAEELDSGMDQGMGGNPYGAGMGGMGGGMGGGAGGMPDMASLMAQMGGGGGMGGAGGMPDMAELMKSMAAVVQAVCLTSAMAMRMERTATTTTSLSSRLLLPAREREKRQPLTPTTCLLLRRHNRASS